jgi:hypothetical protein
VGCSYSRGIIEGEPQEMFGARTTRPGGPGWNSRSEAIFSSAQNTLRITRRQHGRRAPSPPHLIKVSAPRHIDSNQHLAAGPARMRKTSAFDINVY